MDQRHDLQKENSKTLRRKQENLHDHEFGNDFLDMISKAQATKEKTDELNIIKIKNFCASKDTRNKVKRQSTEWVKVFANPISHKGIVFRIYKECLQFNKRQSN